MVGYNCCCKYNCLRYLQFVAGNSKTTQRCNVKVFWQVWLHLYVCTYKYIIYKLNKKRQKIKRKRYERLKRIALRQQSNERRTVRPTVFNSGTMQLRINASCATAVRATKDADDNASDSCWCGWASVQPLLRCRRNFVDSFGIGCLLLAPQSIFF